MNRYLAVLRQFLGFYLSGRVSAQSSSATSVARTFEGGSIKPSRPPKPNSFGFTTRASIVFGPGGRVDDTQATLLDLVSRAFGRSAFEVSGGPNWMTSDHLDVEARAEATFKGGIEQIQAMLRALLVERLKLRTHTETP